MKFVKNNLWIGILTISTVLLAAKQRPALPYFPDMNGYETLVCDFHMHTVFSDGRVWPTERIEEAMREGLDAIALSDHIEHQKYHDDIPANLERPYEVAAPVARERNVLLIKGGEISKPTPPGHHNAIFLTEIEPVNHPQLIDAARAASEQQGFVFWNHHTWKGITAGQWSDLKTEIYENKWLHGMEVANGGTYYPLAHQWCLEKNMTMIGSSDMHAPSIDYVYTPEKHRTLTLVMARQRSVEAIREALFAGRTLVWKSNELIGRQTYLQAMYDVAVSVSPVHHSRGNERFFQITNRSFLNLNLERVGKVGPAQLAIPARSSILVNINMPKGKDRQILSYEVKNMLVAPDKGLPVQIEVHLADAEKKK